MDKTFGEMLNDKSFLRLPKELDYNTCCWTFQIDMNKTWTPNVLLWLMIFGCTRIYSLQAQTGGQDTMRLELIIFNICENTRILKIFKMQIVTSYGKLYTKPMSQLYQEFCGSTDHTCLLSIEPPKKREK